MQAIRPIDQSAIIANRSRAMIGPMTRTYGASQPAPRIDANVQIGVAFVFQSRITVAVSIYGSLDVWGVPQIIQNGACQGRDVVHVIDANKPDQTPHASGSTGTGAANPTPPVTNPEPTTPHDNGNHYGQTKPHSNNGNHYGQTANGRSSFHVTA